MARRGPYGKNRPGSCFFMIWAVMQTYADFEAQIQAVTGAKDYDQGIYSDAAGEVVDALVRGLGLKRDQGSSLQSA